MKYIISDSSITRINETEGTIQIATEGAKIEISDSADFTDVFVLSSLTPKNFSKQLYIRGYGEIINPVEVNVVNFNISEGGGVGNGEGLSAEDTEAIAQAFKAGRVDGNTVSFFVDSDTTGTPAFYFDFPEEIFLDQVGTRLVENFSWGALAYPNSVNPNLEGKTVLVLAVKGDKEVNPTVKYSFVNLEKLIDTYTASDTSLTIRDYKAKVNLDADPDNLLTLTANGLMVDGAAITTPPYTPSDTSVAIANYKVKANISAAANNSLTLQNDGLHVDISGKVDKVAGKDLSTNDFTTAEKTKLAGIETGAQVNVIESVKVNGTALTPSSKAVNIDLSGKINKVANATAGNVPFLASDGGLVNSTIVGGDIITKVAGATEGNIAVFDSDGGIADSAVAIDGVIKKVKDTTAGNFAVFDSDGGLLDGVRNFDKIKVNIPVRYGYKISKTEPDPAARVEYLYDAVGFMPAAMDFSTGVFNFGSWGDTWFVKDIKPLMLKNDGTVDYYLYENDYSIKANGDDVTTPSTAADSDSDVANTEYAGNAMVQFPLIWVKRYEDNDYIYEIVSNVKYDEDYYAFAHTNANGDIKNYFYLGLFEATGNATKLRSLSDQAITAVISSQQQIQACSANGAGYTNTNGTGNGWYVQTWSQSELIRTLIYLLGKSTAPKLVFGYGYITDDSSFSLLNSGVLKDKGMFFGGNTVPSPVKLFHVENIWGNTFERGAGAQRHNKTGIWYVKMTPENGGYNINSFNGMQQVDSNNAIRVYYQYTKTAVISKYGLFTKTFGAASNTYYAQMNIYDDVNSSTINVFGTSYNLGRPMSGNQAAGFGHMGIPGEPSAGKIVRGCRLSFIG